MPTKASKQESESKGFWKRNFTFLDFFKMGLSAVLGFGLKAMWDGLASVGLGANEWAGIGAIFVAIITVAGVIGIDRLRASSEQGFASHVEDLQRDLRKHMDDVHAGVRFVPDVGRSDGDPGYDVATNAVKRAKRRIYVVGDYSPPSSEGAI